MRREIFIFPLTILIMDVPGISEYRGLILLNQPKFVTLFEGRFKFKATRTELESGNDRQAIAE